MDGQVDERMSMIAAGDREIVVSRDVEAPREKVVDPKLDPDALKQWLNGPPGWSLAVCDVEKKAGGKYRFVWTDGNGAKMGMSGVYREYNPPSRLVNTQAFDMDCTGSEVISTLVVTEAAGKTHMTNTLLYPS